MHHCADSVESYIEQHYIVIRLRYVTPRHAGDSSYDIFMLTAWYVNYNAT